MATKTASGWTPLTKALSKQAWKKFDEWKACIESDLQTSKGMINQTPSAKTVQAKIELEQAQAAMKKEMDCPTVTNPC